MRGGAAADAPGWSPPRATRRPTTSRCSPPRSRSTAWPPSASPGQHGENLAEDAITVSVRTEKDGTWSAWQTMPYHDEHGPDAGSDESRPHPAGHRPGVRRPRRRRADQGRHRVRRRPRRHAARAGRPGRPDRRRRSRSRPSTPAPWTCPPPTPPPPPRRPTRPTATRRRADHRDRPGVTDPAETGNGDATGTTDPTRRDHRPAHRRGRLAGGRRGHRQADDLLAGPVGRRRADARQVLAALRRGARRASCTTRSTRTTTPPPRCPRSSAASTPTTPSPAAGPTSATTSWSTASAGSGRAGTAAWTVPSSVRTRSATTTTRSRCPRSATTRPRSRRPRCSTPTAGCSPGSSACTASAPASTKQWVTKKYLPAINGHRDVGQTACPGKYLYAQIPQDPHARGGLPEVLRQPEPLREPHRYGAPGRRRCATRPPSRATCCAPAGTSGYAAGTVAASGPLRRRPASPPSATSPVTARADVLARTRTTRAPRSTRATAPGTTAPRPRRPRGSPSCDLLTGVGDWNGDGQNDVVGRNAHHQAALRLLRRRHRRLRCDAPAALLRLGRLPARSSGAGDLEQRRPPRPDRPRLRRTGCGWSPGTGSRLGARHACSPRTGPAST